ncbi:M23 family metallopeptidase [uncultured Selenomonas sp.]|uniref:M23 family metallopeptidase n=1 Tax=uncultured Selenomonas sp. TaxID=159275 RepID=UPI0025ECCB68|nr:M23 family metallopeptidase [uncultured Selenomonas sp.]
MPEEKESKAESYTIKIVPDKGDTTHSITLSAGMLRYGLAMLAVCALLFVGAFSYGVYSTMTARADASEIEELREVNSIQQEQLLQLSKKAYSLQQQMEELTQMEQELRRQTGAPAADDNASGDSADAQNAQNGQGGPYPASILGRPEERIGMDGVRAIERGNVNIPALSQMLLQTKVHESEQELFGSVGGPAIAPDVQNVRMALDDLEKRVAARRASLENLKQTMREQNKLLAPGASLAGGITGPAVTTPSIWPTNGIVSSPYGLRWGGSDFHPGIDIANDMGTPIVATADGTVVAAGWNSGGYGNMVDIDHGNGILTRYGHAMQVVVVAGQYVRRGQVIAYMGSTGYSTGPHCHYEVRINGSPVNPVGYL